MKRIAFIKNSSKYSLILILGRLLLLPFLRLFSLDSRIEHLCGMLFDSVTVRYVARVVVDVFVIFCTTFFEFDGSQLHASVECR